MRNRIRETDDFYRTPPECGRLIAHMVKDAWEPCAGDGALLDVIPGIIVASDIKPRRVDIYKMDFLSTQTISGNARMIVTNPPFSLNKEIILHARRLGLPALLLIRLEWLNAQTRKDLQDYVSYVGIVSNLVKFTTEDGRIVNGNGTGRVAWVRFEIEPVKEKKIEWLHYGDQS